VVQVQKKRANEQFLQKEKKRRRKTSRRVEKKEEKLGTSTGASDRGREQDAHGIGVSYSMCCRVTQAN